MYTSVSVHVASAYVYTHCTRNNVLKSEGLENLRIVNALPIENSQYNEHCSKMLHHNEEFTLAHPLSCINSFINEILVLTCSVALTFFFIGKFLKKMHFVKTLGSKLRSNTARRSVTATNGVLPSS